MNETRQTLVVDERTRAFYMTLLITALLDVIMLLFCVYHPLPRAVSRSIRQPQQIQTRNDDAKPSPFTLASTKAAVKKPAAPRAVLVATGDKKGAEWFTLRP